MKRLLIITLGVAVLLGAAARADTPWESKVKGIATPLGFYRVDEPSGATMTAKVGTNGTYVATVTYGVTGSPIYRCENNTAVEKAGTIANSDDWNVGDTTFTLVVFAKAASAPASLSHLLARGTETLPSYTLAIRATGVASCRVRNTDLAIATAIGATNIADNAWHMVVCTYDGTNIKIYIDNVLDATQAQTGDVQNASQTERVTGPDAPDVTFSIDEPIIYDALLTAAQLADLYIFSKQCGNGGELTMEF